MSSKKVYQNAHEAMRGILRDGLTILSGGFGICGIAENITEEIKNSKVKDLTVVSNNCGIDGYGLGTLLQTRQIKKMISSYVGENKTFEEQYLNGDLELEFSPQGTLAERCRAARGRRYTGILHKNRCWDSDCRRKRNKSHRWC